MSKKQEKQEKKFDFKEFLEETIVEDRKKSLDSVKEEWRDLMLNNPEKKREKN